jgi:hypothetical protein
VCPLIINGAMTEINLHGDDAAHLQGNAAEVH